MVTLRLEAALMEIYKGLDELDSAIPLTRTEIAVELFKGTFIRHGTIAAINEAENSDACILNIPKKSPS